MIDWNQIGIIYIGYKVAVKKWGHCFDTDRQIVENVARNLKATTLTAVILGCK